MHGLAIPETLAEATRPETTALVVYDMQIGILRQLEEGPAILERVLQTVQIARSAGIRIFFMRHMSLPTRMAGVFQFRQMMAWQRKSAAEDVHPWFLRDSPGFALAPELEVRDDEAIFDKITFSAFEGTPLAIAMRDCGLKSFLICGIATEIGIEPTVRHGADLGLIPIVVTDACGGGDAEAADRAMASMKYMGDAMLCTVEDLSAVWG
ncbi:isochorismatase [Phyllobacterium zundukense]|uniref:Isochorismatase n=1 Tax=Phyllobacterium zundukense TaxID=1867719 RepID=A0A2N9W538_9HYPH|nr:isochorismatase [Phyllobacterium zundukense]PIO46856.1 isochorismatase [Phyllobacterium zundukense]